MTHPTDPLDAKKQHEQELNRKYQRRWYEKNRQKKLELNDEYRKKNWERIKELSYKRRDPYKFKANQAVNNAIAAGKFEKKPCEECGDPKADFHHNNGYDKDNWFTGVWLCRQHHHNAHKELRWKTNSARF